MKQESGADIVERKVIPVTGDCSLPDLGLSVADRQMLIDNVTVVYHMAATIRFDAPLKQAVLLNARGVKLMIQLAREMKNLQVRRLRLARKSLRDRPKTCPHNLNGTICATFR